MGRVGEKDGELNFQNVRKKRVQIFPTKRKVLVKYGVVLNKGWYHLLSYSLTLSSVIFLWIFGVCVFLFKYTISTSIICVSLKELTLIASNQQIYDFYKWEILEKKKHCESKFLISIQCNTDSCCEDITYITGSINMYLYGSVSLLAPKYICISPNKICVAVSPS